LLYVVEGIVTQETPASKGKCCLAFRTVAADLLLYFIPIAWTVYVTIYSKLHGVQPWMYLFTE
jgi:hypothetical protein